MSESIDSSKSDFKINKGGEKTQRPEEKEDKLTNIVFSGMIVLTVIGTALILHNLHDFTKDLEEKNPSYKFPKYSEMYISFLITGILIMAKILIEKLVLPVSELILASKYKNPQDIENYTLGRVYVKKLSTNMFKLMFYFFMTIFGFLILSQLEYFPTSLGGKGSMMKMFEAGYPNSFYHWKPDYFDIYYLTALSFCFTDLIWLVFIYELQSDFLLMLLHHLCTISLLTFSYLTNYSNAGCITLFLHDIGDIFVYTTRIVINTDSKSIIKLLTAIVLLIVFIYTRLYVLGELLFNVMYGISWKYRWPEAGLLLFIVFLYIMHINWVYLILKKIVRGFWDGNKLEDPATVKKVAKTN